MIYAPTESPLPTPHSAAFRFENLAPLSTAVGAAVGSCRRGGPLPVRIELGRARMHVSQVMEIAAGALLGLDVPADCGVDIQVGDRPVARGEILVQDGNYCIRVTELIGHPTPGASRPHRPQAAGVPCSAR